MKFLVFGSTGWIGHSVLSTLNSHGYWCEGVDRQNINEWLASDLSAFHVIYCIGLTADFRHRLFDTVQAHVEILSRILNRNPSGLTYLSSTRLYSNSNSTSESQSVLVNSSCMSDLYAISKLMGESLVLSYPCESMRVVRLSNVVGSLQSPNTFVGEILSECVRNGFSVIREHSSSSKDYISLEKVSTCIVQIALSGIYRIYNVASGFNTTHQCLSQLLRANGLDVRFSSEDLENSQPQKHPVIDISRLSSEFGPPLSNPFSDLLESL